MWITCLVRNIMFCYFSTFWVWNNNVFFSIWPIADIYGVTLNIQCTCIKTWYIQFINFVISWYSCINWWFPQIYNRACRIEFYYLVVSGVRDIDVSWWVYSNSWRWCKVIKSTWIDCIFQSSVAMINLNSVIPWISYYHVSIKGNFNVAWRIKVIKSWTWIATTQSHCVISSAVENLYSVIVCYKQMCAVCRNSLRICELSCLITSSCSKTWTISTCKVFTRIGSSITIRTRSTKS